MRLMSEEMNTLNTFGSLADGLVYQDFGSYRQDFAPLQTSSRIARRGSICCNQILAFLNLHLMISPYRKDHYNIFLSFDNDSQVKSHFKAFECFVDEDILNSGRGNELCAGCREISRRRA